ncbi:fatty acyl-AMP ligase [Cellulosimicrobium cellulans]|uniref:Putative acyl-CoA synthase/polyketide synthase n=1 Tax=Cellulosimicrobium cellulans TaxID=1710 RepID=A0A4Y4E4Q6_CELCE|nr:fatty acyl-AMP ligase [Cellulosimicrobium cellulans]GED11967.1 putative acyl-CoA synthase/polyketide synthase [Cellulosimicrobium cellulans]
MGAQPDDLTLVDLVHEHARERPDHAAVVVVPEVGERRTLTYAELDAQAAALAADLAARHEPGDRALVLYSATASFVVGIVACFYAGLIPAPSPLPGGQAYQRERVRGMLVDCDAAVVLVDPTAATETTEWAEPLRRADGGPVVVTVVDGATDGPARRGRPGPQDVAFLQYTSGSTSSPKGVVVTHANVLHHHDAFSTTLGLVPEDVFCSWLPGYHDFGLVGMLLVPLGLGATAVIVPSTSFLKRPVRWLSAITETGATVTASPNFGYDQCARRVRDDQLAELDLTRLRWALGGAEPVDPAVLDAFTRRFEPVGFRGSAHGPGYGLAEATLTATYPDRRLPLVITADEAALADGRLVVLEEASFLTALPDAAAQGRGSVAGARLVCCGPPSGVELRLVDDQGAEVPDGTVGEVWLRGGTVAAGYWGDAAATATAETFGAVAADGTGPWLRTGDLGALHGGQLVVTGRIKELLIVAGRNLYPYDLERELRRLHPGAEGRPGAVFEAEGLPGTLCAVQEFRPTPGARLDGASAEDELDAVVRQMASHLASVSGAAVHDVVLVRPGQVPRTTSGKIQRGRARDLHGGGDLAELHSLRASRDRARTELAGTRS